MTKASLIHPDAAISQMMSQAVPEQVRLVLLVRIDCDLTGNTAPGAASSPEPGGGKY
jgi:hypothetical protein